MDYSRERGVKVIAVEQPRRGAGPARSSRNWFDMCNRVGVAGVKIDFFDHEHKEVIDLYEMMAKAAARAQAAG